MKKKKINVDLTDNNLLDEEYFNLINFKLIFQKLDKSNYLKYIFYILIFLFFFKYDKIIINQPYLSICLSALNMENYIEINLLSIINQSFQNFEIIIINDFSNDNTENIIKQIN